MFIKCGLLSATDVRTMMDKFRTMALVQSHRWEFSKFSSGELSSLFTAVSPRSDSYNPPYGGGGGGTPLDKESRTLSHSLS